MEEPGITKTHPPTFGDLNHGRGDSSKTDLADVHARCTAACSLLQP